MNPENKTEANQKPEAPINSLPNRAYVLGIIMLMSGAWAGIDSLLGKDTQETLLGAGFVLVGASLIAVEKFLEAKKK